jgi:hypothetical protein
MHAILPFLLCAAPASSQPAMSSTGLSYSYVELGFAVLRPDEDRADLGGGAFAEFDDAQAIGVSASFSLSETFFVQGGLALSDQDVLVTDGVDEDNGQYEARSFTVGLGARHPLGTAVDAYAVAGLASLSADLEFPGIGSESNSETGLAVELGLRAMVASPVEIQAYFSRVDLYEATNTFGGAVRFHATESLALGLSAQVSEDASSLGLGVRFGF